MTTPHGPWTDLREACNRWWKFLETKSIDGRLPVATERKNGAVRLLYVLPNDGREPIPVTAGLPEYVSLEGMKK